MRAPHDHPVQMALGFTLLALAVPAWLWVYHPVQPAVLDPALFLFLHNAVEIFAVVVAALVFVTGYRAVLSARNGAVVLLGVGFLGVGLLDALHTMSYAGMPNAISANTPQKSIFFGCVHACWRRYPFCCTCHCHAHPRSPPCANA